MPEFEFEGRNATGKLVKGKMIADSEAHVANQLQQENVIPIRITTVTGNGISLESIFGRLFQKKTSVEVLLLFSRQMYSLCRAGVPLATAISRLVDVLPISVFSSTLKSIEVQLNAGKSLSACMKEHPAIFPGLLIALVTAGEANGRLDIAFLHASEHYELEATTRKLVKNTLRYPIFVFTAICIASTILYIFVIPRFAKLYSTFHQQLPLPTRIIFGTSDFIRTHWYFIFGLIILIVLGIFFLLQKESVRKKYDELRYKIPIIGPILERMTMANFSKTFSILMQTGVPVLDAVALSAEVTNNAFAKEKILLMRANIEKGESLAQAAREANFFSSLVLQMLAVGEETGDVDKSLLEVSDFYEREINFEIKKLADRIEPIILIFIGGIVLILALGVFLPIWNLINVIH